MKTFSRTMMLLVSLALLLASPAHAAAAAAAKPPPANPAELLGLSNGTIKGEDGDWVEYANYEKGKIRLDDTFRMVLVLDPNGVKGRWVEIWLDKTGRTAVRFQLDTTDSPDGPLMYLRLNSAVYLANQAPADTCADGKCHGQPTMKGDSAAPVSVSVVAGTFQCIHIMRGVTRVWYSDSIPMLRLVKAVMPDGHGYELVAMGHHSQFAFPKKFTAKPFPVDKLSGMLKAFGPSATPAAPVPACDPATSTCEPVAGEKPSEKPGEIQQFKPKPKP